MKYYNNIIETIGNTPLIKLKKVNESKALVLAKVETFNPGHSIKDRIGDDKMANQDPQPEIYRVNAAFDPATAAGTTSVTNITTSQANNEEVRIYALQVAILDELGTGLAGTADDLEFDVKITVGANNVPSQTFSLTPALLSDSKMLTLPSPILVLCAHMHFH